MGVGSRRFLTTGLFYFAFVLSGCGDDEESSASGRVHAKAVDAKTRAPLPNALVVVEQGTIYAQNPDRTKGNPSYLWGARADANGVFDFELPTGNHGFHAFASGHRYGPMRSQIDGGQTHEMTFQLEPEIAMDVDPVVGDVTLSSTTVAAGASVEIEANVTAGDDDESSNISEEVLLVAPHALTSLALDPPSPGCQAAPLGCPDGVFHRTFTAPNTAGTFEYYFVVSSEACVTSDPVELTLTVQ